MSRQPAVTRQTTGGASSCQRSGDGNALQNARLPCPPFTACVGCPPTSSNG
jgi:hypothetical protein